MKTRILFLAVIMCLATVSANNNDKSTSKIGVNYHYNESVTFFERGIKFHVFLNGDFDFNTHPQSNRYYDVNGYRYGNGGVRIEKDYRGRVRRVGNVFINYDRRGNVKRIGSVHMRYKYGNLSRVGNLRIKYNRWGQPHFKGSVKRNKHYYYDDDYYEDDYYDRDDFNIEFDVNIDIFDYDDVYFYRRDFRDNYNKFREDNNFYYYKATPNAKVNEKRKFIKRRKPSKNIRHYNKNKRRIATPEQTGKSRRSR